jgi:hypothetical protein
MDDNLKISFENIINGRKKGYYNILQSRAESADIICKGIWVSSGSNSVVRFVPLFLQQLVHWHRNCCGGGYKVPEIN